jgi:hypothetical protein
MGWLSAPVQNAGLTGTARDEQLEPAGKAIFQLDMLMKEPPRIEDVILS